jgi:hypothetical protein
MLAVNHGGRAGRERGVDGKNAHAQQAIGERMDE